MTGVLSPSILMEKAGRALAAARLLLEANDTDGACNRAYYAMFDAAHAALFTLGIEKLDAPIKTHNGLVAMFGLHLVRGNRLPAEHGEALNAAQRFRQVADYTGDFVSLADATWAIERAEAFVAAIRVAFGLT